MRIYQIQRMAIMSAPECRGMKRAKRRRAILVTDVRWERANERAAEHAAKKARKA